MVLHSGSLKTSKYGDSNSFPHFKTIWSKAINYCQKERFQALIAAISKIKTLTLKILWNRIVAGVKMIPQRTLIKGRMQGLSPGACQRGKRIRSITHQQCTQKHLQMSDRMLNRLCTDHLRMVLIFSSVFHLKWHWVCADPANSHIMKLI